jgi:hypothetical protein
MSCRSVFSPYFTPPDPLVFIPYLYCTVAPARDREKLAESEATLGHEQWGQWYATAPRKHEPKK